MTLPLVIVLMLLVASAVAMATRKLRVPYTVALVVTGLVLSVVRSTFYPDVDVGIHLTKELLFVALLPVLIFEAAFHLELKEFLNNWRAILTLAVPGLVFGIALCGGLFYAGARALELPLSFGGALLVATILAATDPVGVISLLRATSAPRRLAVLMEGESLLNDGVAVVAFTVVLVALGLDPHHAHVTVPWLIKFMSWEILGALFIGGGVGLLMAWLTTRVDDHLIEITLSTIAAFGSFLAAERAHASGVIACLVAGMLAGNFGAKVGMSASTRVAVISFWEYAAFVANSITFLLIGMDIDPGKLLEAWPAILIVWGAMLASRGLFVSATLPWLGRFEGAMPKGFGTVIAWGGVRGGIAMVLALSIPRELEARELAVSCIFGASLLTILVQSTTMGTLLRRLGLAKSRKAFEVVERLRGRMRALHSALAYLDRQREEGVVAEEIHVVLRKELTDELEALKRQRQQSEGMVARVRQEELLTLRRKILLVRKASLHQASADGAVDERVMRQLVGELDEKLHLLDHASEEMHSAMMDEVEAAAAREKSPPRNPPDDPQEH